MKTYVIFALASHFLNSIIALAMLSFAKYPLTQTYYQWEDGYRVFAGVLLAVWGCLVLIDEPWKPKGK